jgi:PIN domain
MRELFAPTEELPAQLDISYERIILAPQMALRHLNSLLDREYTAWDDRLAQLVTELEQQHKFTSRPGQPVVLDTSVLMEGGQFAEVPWSSADASLATGQIRLIVPILVVEELDDLLHDRRGDRKQRARTVTRGLIGLHRASPTEPAALPEQPHVTIEVLLDGDWHQRRPNNDAVVRPKCGQPSPTIKQGSQADRVLSQA